MADHSLVMSQVDISVLKETLCAQQKLLQKLYYELDAEREASATAASESLSVILRLQGEKAAVKMEAEQYKRLSEEKMCHAEESFAIIEDIIYQKEMEVAALNYQAQSYKYKLLSMGWVDPGVGEIKYPDNLLQMNECLTRDKNFPNIGRRNSAPPLKFKISVNERETSTNTETDSMTMIVEEQTGKEINGKALDLYKNTDNSTTGSISSYWEQIRKLDERVKEVAGDNLKDFKNDTNSPSISSRPSTDTLYDQSSLQNEGQSPSQQLNSDSSYETSKVVNVKQIDLTSRPGNVYRNGVVIDYPCSPSVHDVFEVPQVDQNLISCEAPTKEKKKMVSQVIENVESGEDAMHSKYAKYDHGWLKKSLEIKPCKTNVCKTNEITAIDYHLGTVQQSASVSDESHSRINQRNRRSEILEFDRSGEFPSREEELKLLNEIKEKLDSLHYDIRSLKSKHISETDDPSSSFLVEIPSHSFH